MDVGLTTMKTVYCIIGKKRAGKDTIADYICKKKGCKKYALAKPLKDLVCNIFGITMEQLDLYKNEDWELYADRQDGPPRSDDFTGINFRSILQRTGDSMKTFFGLDCYMKKFHAWMLNEDIAVISDVRLREEQKWLMTHTSPIFIKVVRRASQVSDTHHTETETETLGFDILIENNGTLEDLYTKIDKVVK